MTAPAHSLDQMTTALVPSLSKSLAEPFNVFRVMHHGTHEKQLSNVFAWLLSVDETHELGDAFQRLFVEQVNQALPDSTHLPDSGYRVTQEVDTAGRDGLSSDIADIVLSNASASIVVENYEASDGHGHDYHRYLAYGAEGGKQSVVVLLCARHESHLQTEGWEHAVVLTYAELLERLSAHVGADTAWQEGHPPQHFFIQECIQHFTEGHRVVSNEDRIVFIKTMCETGESARYGHRPQERAALEFADLLAQHAKRQFEEGRRTLSEVKRALKRYSEGTLIGQVNDALPSGHIDAVRARLMGQWEWHITLRRTDSAPSVSLDFGPTVLVQNGRASVPLVDPDYTKIFVTRHVTNGQGIDRIIQTEVGLDEVLTGLDPDDFRLRESILTIINQE
ncbi:PD-(D/E)XK nuclease family protein [Nesterenkonia muleiensis]|uniref:PD-(D/E)XK nuclease family protein n=1 Tax=Nesterenkonia muleiensis TaxID=2282648 RepID=UPI000E76ED92|nr:PD-(D/E)XK nuclease family protein [Nesterenkonia muleiensis]